MVKTKNWKARSNTLIVLQINYSELENKGDDVTYVVDDCSLEYTSLCYE